MIIVVMKHKICGTVLIKIPVGELFLGIIRLNIKSFYTVNQGTVYLV
jgi:hypothetical protein